MSDAQTPTPARPEPIKAVPVRHPWRWVAMAVLAVLTAMFAHMLVTNKNFHWSFMADNMFRPPIIEGVRTTVLLTITAMVIGVALGVVIAVLRLSPNPIMSKVAFVYTWFFRAVPRLVLLTLFGNLGILWERIGLGVPFDHQIGKLFGIDNLDAKIFSIKAITLLSGFLAAMLALALSEAAYMAEIVRAGIASVDPGQTEASEALGMSRGQTLRRIILPQAMRVIVPPTGNEAIAMLKDTSLVIAVPVSNELFFQLRQVGSREFLPFPMLVAACLWYLLLVSVMMVGQYYVERYFSRGYGGKQQGKVKPVGVDTMGDIEVEGGPA